MRFDPALAARAALLKALDGDDLGQAYDRVVELEQIFSSTAGDPAGAAYDALYNIGALHPNAQAYQEFLIYITWQQFAEAMTPRYVERGLALCDQYVDRWGSHGEAGERILEIRDAFAQAVGLAREDEEDEYEQDTFKGGD